MSEQWNQKEDGMVDDPGNFNLEAPTFQDIMNRFTYHPPKSGQVGRYEDIRDKARSLAVLIVGICPTSCERSLAITKIEEAVMWANAAIARNE
jgi:hypothetical protein